MGTGKGTFFLLLLLLLEQRPNGRISAVRNSNLGRGRGRGRNKRSETPSRQFCHAPGPEREGRTDVQTHTHTHTKKEIPPLVFKPQNAGLTRSSNRRLKQSSQATSMRLASCILRAPFYISIYPYSYIYNHPLLQSSLQNVTHFTSAYKPNNKD